MYCSSAQGGDFAPIGCIELPIIPDFAWRNGWVCFKRDRGFVHVVGFVFLLLLLLLSCFVLHPFGIQLVHFVPSRYLKSCCLRRPTWPWSGKTSVFFFFPTHLILFYIYDGDLDFSNMWTSFRHSVITQSGAQCMLQGWECGEETVLMKYWADCDLIFEFCLVCQTENILKLTFEHGWCSPPTTARN